MKSYDVRLGLRITSYRCRTVIAFEVDDSAAKVSVLGIFYGGRDYERVLGDFNDVGDTDAD